MANIDVILNTLDELLENSWSLPLSGGRCVVDADRVRDLIDDIRLNMPGEIKQAKAVVADRNEILAIAKQEAEDLIRKAEERAKGLMDKETIVHQAKTKAMSILNEAEQKAKEIIGRATAQATETINQATARASEAVSQANARANEAISKANARAHEAVSQATSRAREMKQAAYDFSDSRLQAIEEVLERSLAEVKATHQALKNPPDSSRGGKGRVDQGRGLKKDDSF